MLAAVENIIRRAGLHGFTAEHDDGAVRHLRDHAHVMGDEEHRHALFVLQRLDQIEDLALDGDVECCRRLVGDQQLRPGRKRHGDHHALAHAAGKLMRIFVETVLRIRDAHAIEQPQHLRLRLGVGDIAMAGDGLGDLLADRKDRIEGSHRLLKDHRDLVAAHLAHLLGIERQKLAPLQLDAAFDAAGDLRQKPHDRKRGDAFARPRFADDRDRFTGRDIEVHVAHN